MRKQLRIVPKSGFLLLILFVLQMALGTGETLTTTYSFTNFVGNPGGLGNADGTGTSARFRGPFGIAIDSQDNLYIADTSNSLIRKITPGGVVTTIAGICGYFGWVDGPVTNAQLNAPQGVALDTSGNLYIADTGNNCIRKLDVQHSLVSTIAGNALLLPGALDGKGTNALFNEPHSLVVDSAGNVFATDFNNSAVRKIATDGTVTTFAGKLGSQGHTDGQGNTARFKDPEGITIDSSGNLYVADSENNSIRKITSLGQVSTFAGQTNAHAGYTDGTGDAAYFSEPTGICIDNLGNLFVTETVNYDIRQITPSRLVSTLSGAFQSPVGIVADSAGNLFVVDHRWYEVLKRYSYGRIITFAGLREHKGTTSGMGTNGLFWWPSGVAVTPTRQIFVSDSLNDLVRLVTTNGFVSTLAGIAGTNGNNDGPATNATFSYPSAILSDRLGNCYVISGHAIRMISTNGTVSTFAGNGSSPGFTNDVGTSARFKNPSGMAFDPLGNLYVADSGNHVVRKIDPTGSVSTFAGEPGIKGYQNGQASLALFNDPQDVSVDFLGNVAVADSGNYLIRLVTSDGNVSTIAGSNGKPGTADGTGSEAKFSDPEYVTFDYAQNIFVTDGNSTIRVVSKDGTVNTIAGRPGVFGGSDGNDTSAVFNRPQKVAIDQFANLYVADLVNNRISKGTPLAFTPEIMLIRHDTNVLIPFTGRLLSSPAINIPFTDIPSAMSPLVLPVLDQQSRFFRSDN